ncbi:MAG: phage tail protein [Rhodocyclaceae bacterium]|nr:phage tail protein [Rhodocyclaceae bacterium]
MNPLIIGAGGGGGKGGGGSTGGHVPVESPDSLRSRQYARVVDLVSEGEIVGLVDGLKSVYLDGTPVQNANGGMNFAGVTLISRTGTQAQSYIPGFPSVENEVAVGVEVTNALSVTRTITTANIDGVRVTVSVPRLTYQNPTNGDLGGASVSIAIDVQNDGAGFVEMKTDTITGKASAKYQRAYRIELPGDGPWDIRVRRLTADSTESNRADGTWWDSYTEITDAKLRYPNSALCAMQVDAEQFRAIPRRGYEIKGLIVKVPVNYDPATRVYAGVWDGTFKLAWTDNPAWCFHDLLTAERYGLGAYIDATQIDKWGLYDIARHCDELVPDGFGGTEPRFTCNLYLQTREEAYKVIQNMASIFRGIAWWQAGSIMVSADKPTDPSMLFTAANVIDGKFSYSGSARKARHTVALVSWNDPADQYRQKVEYVEDEAGIGLHGVRESEVLAFGCTSRGQAHRFGKWLLWSEIYETETETHDAGLDGVYLAPGAVYQTQDAARAGKRFGGRLLAATAGAVTLDAAVVIEAGKIYTLSCVMPDGTLESRAVANAAGTTDAITLAVAFSAVPQVLSVWVLAANDLVPESWRLVSVAESEPGRLTVSGLTYNPQKFAAVEQGVQLQPVETSAISTAAPATPTGLTVAETHYEVLTEVRARVHVAWDAAFAVRWVVAWRRGNDNWIEAPATSASWDIDPVLPGSLEVRVYAVSALGRMSAPATHTITVVGTTGGPGDVTGLVLEEPWAAPDCRLLWNALARSDWYEVEVWQSSVLRATHKTSDARFTYTFARNVADGGPWRAVTFKVYAVVSSTRSANAATLAASNPQIGAPGGLAWAPVIDGMTVSWEKPAGLDYAGSMLVVSSTTNFDPALLTPVYDGPDTFFMVAGLTAGTPYYARVGCYDDFGKDGVTWSSEFSATPTGANADPATMLADINTLLTDGSGTDKIQLLADRFSIKAPTGDKIPFGLVESSPGVWKALLNADVLIGGNLSVANLTAGALPNDVIFSLGGGVVQLDGAGEIRAYAGPGSNQDFVSLTAAQLLFKMYIAGTGYVTYNYLSRIEAGVANNNDTVAIPGYWKEQPRVMVAPASLGLYKTAYANQDQSIQCQALSLQEVVAGSGRWQFNAVATLNLAANTGSTVINGGSGDISANSWTSSTYTTPANCATITPSVSVKSQRGNGTGQYYYRSIRWRVEYWSGSAWVPLAWRVVNMGAQFNAITDSGLCTFPSAAAWQWRIYAEQYDTDGTVWGGASYEYSSEVLGGNWELAFVIPSGGSNPSTTYGSYLGLPASTLNPTWEIYQISYNANISTRWHNTQGCTTTKQVDVYPWNGQSNNWYNHQQSDGSCGPFWSGSGALDAIAGDYSVACPATTSPSRNFSLTETGSNLTYNNTTKIRPSAVYQFAFYTFTAKLSYAVAVTIYRRRAITNSTTPVNNTYLNSYNYSLTSAQVLATGSLNWTAMGR